ncbi:MAG TPA: phosphatidate cytidylyltransferase [Myxococcota bacterium]
MSESASATPPSPARPDGELRARLLTASILVPAVLWVIYMGGLWVLGLVVVVTLLAQREFYGLIEDKGAHPLEGFGLAGGAALPVVAYLGNEYHATVLMTMTLLIVMLAQLGRRRISDALASISGTFFGVFYVGWLLSHAVVLRQFYDQVVAREGVEGAIALGFVPESGAFLLTYTLAVVVLCDAGGYFAGFAYGKRKLAPRISPSKTVEGTIGGVITGTLGGLVIKAGFDLLWGDLSMGLSWTAALVFGVAISGLAVVGDLVESLLKRDAQVKDAGAVLPGMGGILDRVDSPLLGIPGMYYMMLFYVFLQAN